MKLKVSTNPHVKDKDSVNKIMWYVILSLLPAAGAGIYFFGENALWILLLSIVSAVLTELIIQKLMKRKITIKDGSAVLTGLLLGLILSPAVPLWIPILGAVFAIAIGKMVFGGLGHNIFNPALVGRVFLVASWPALMTKWLLIDGTTGATPLGMLKLEGITTDYLTMFLGNIGGSIGETSAVALLIGALFLFLKKIIDWRIPFSYIGTVAVFAFIFGQDPLFHILAGGLLIGAFFMATDYVSSPITKNGRLIFGFGCGFLTIIFRLFSGYAEGVMFSILLMNSLTPLIDRFTRIKPFGYKKK
jgi:electron transport complex protein RnfD